MSFTATTARPGSNAWRDTSPSTVIAGLVAVLIGYGSSAAIIFQAAQAAGANGDQIGSWMWALGIGMGLTSLGLSWYHRMPLLTAWSTPGAALLVTQLPGVPFDQAIGAFMVSAALLTLCGVSGLAERLMRLVPASLASAMLAGILLSFGLDLFGAMQQELGLPLVLAASWLIARRFAPRLAIPTVFATGLAMTLVQDRLDLSAVELAVTTPSLVVPSFSPAVCLGVGVPLFIVTMATQNLPGVAMVRSAGFPAPVSSAIGWTGAASLLLAPFGAHGLNLAAISAAPCLGDEAHVDAKRRYTAGIAAGIGYLLLGAFGAGVAALFTALPSVLVMAVAGLALLGTLGAGLATAFAEPGERDAALVTFLMTASQITLWGIGSAFWGLLAGMLVARVLRKA
ncbi:benzoate/H(+) symporter BenE family transporter [Halomonas sp. V046]|uniref:benzoate/H(+) symporter BenE family transporter n=1 Tax=Halomonas sp. V046 TaxID=3459611 RepID=UPI004043F177